MRHRSNTVLIHDEIDRGLSPRCSRLPVEAFCIDKYFLGKFGRSRFERMMLVQAYSYFKLHITISIMFGKKVNRYKELDLLDV
jgi:hypothetical protein